MLIMGQWSSRSLSRALLQFSSAKLDFTLGSSAFKGTTEAEMVQRNISGLPGETSVTNG